MQTIQPGLISVIIPVYNAEKTLNACVESVLSQSYSRIEVILVDDGSKDGSAALCRQIADRDGRVKFFSQPNAGPAAARNTALDAVTGEFLTFADSDDFFVPGAFQKMIDAMDGSDLVIAHYYMDVGKVSSPRGLLSGNRTLTEREFLMALMQKPGSFYFSVLWNKMYRTELVRQQRLRFDPFFSWGEDSAFNMAYYRVVKSAALVEDPVYHYVKSAGSSSVRTLFNLGRSFRIKARLYRRLKELYVEKGLYARHRFTLRKYLFYITLKD